METANNGPAIYSPSAVLHLFNNSIAVAQTRRIIQLRGVFLPGKGTPYNGYYYDSLRDESSDAQLTIIVAALLREELQVNKTVTVNGFITRRVVTNASRIELQLTVTELVEQTHNKYADEDLRRLDVLQAKAAAGYRDVHSWIKEQIIREQPFKIGILIGRSAIIDNDIKHQLRESIGYYQLTFHRISLSAAGDIADAMRRLDGQGYAIIVLSRGGGEQLDVFNKPELAEASIGLKALFVTAIGHKDDVTLLQRVADKAFITPSELGQFLNDTYNQTVEELQHSRAKLVAAVTAQLQANYQKQIDNLNEKLKGVEELKKKSNEDLKRVYDEKIAALNKQMETVTAHYNTQLAQTQKLQEEQLVILNQQVQSLHQQNQSKDSLIQSYKGQVASLEQKTSFSWMAVIIGIIIGIVLGLLLHGH